jgi:hypothetical protein
MWKVAASWLAMGDFTLVVFTMATLSLLKLTSAQGKVVYYKFM